MTLIVDRIIFRLLRLFLDERGLEDFFASYYGAVFRRPGLRRKLEANLRRVLARVRGREPGPRELDEALARLARLQAAVASVIFTPPAGLEARLDRVDFDLLPILQALLKEGRGAVLASPHFGNHALMVYALAKRGVPLTVIYITGSRFQRVADEIGNLRMLDLGWSAVEAMGALRRGEAVLLFDDIDFFPDGRVMDFFGAPYHPPHGPARLAVASGAPVLPVYAVAEGDRCRLACGEPIRAEAGQEAIETGLLRSMEDFIGRHPDQWLAFRDVWDLEGSLAERRSQLAAIKFSRGVGAIWDGVKGLLRRP